MFLAVGDMIDDNLNYQHELKLSTWITFSIAESRFYYIYCFLIGTLDRSWLDNKNMFK